MPNERPTSSVSDPHEGDLESAPAEHAAKPVDPFRKQLDSQPREMGKPGQSGFFRPQLEDGRYSLRNVPAESVHVRSSSVPSPVPPAAAAAPARGAPAALHSSVPGHAALGQAVPGQAVPGHAVPDNLAQSDRLASFGVSEAELEVPPTLQAAAERWRVTGVSPVPAHASSRHARAMQRAMLLALMQRFKAGSPTEPSGELPIVPLPLPPALSQRAAWLFRAGWHADPVEFDSCLALLDIRDSPEVKQAILALIAAHSS